MADLWAKELLFLAGRNWRAEIFPCKEKAGR